MNHATQSTPRATAEVAMKVLASIWGNRQGYVWLPTLNRFNDAPGAVWAKGWSDGRAYEWPKEKKAILADLKDRWHSEVDLYFSAGVFSQPKRKTEFLISRDRIWADLDSKNPCPHPGDIKPAPAFVWSTSEKNYQAVWLFDRMMTKGEWRGRARQFTEVFHADAGGWHETKILRVPGSINHKPEHGKQGVRGGVLRAAPTRFVVALPAPSQRPSQDASQGTQDTQASSRARRVMHDTPAMSGEDVLSMMKTARHGGSVRSFVRRRDIEGGMNFSGLVWKHMRRMAEYGYTADQIAAVMSLSAAVRDKYSPASILTQANKAVGGDAR